MLTNPALFSRERWALVAEEKDLLAKIEAGGGVPNDKLDSRLGEVYEQMEVREECVCVCKWCV